MLHVVAGTLLVALGSVQGFPASSSATDASALLQPCASSASSCEVLIRFPQELVLSGNAKVGRGRTLRVLPGGRLILRGGGTLDFNSSETQAPPDEHIFGGEGHVRGLGSAYPEWFADPIEAHVYPPAALREAYAATVALGTIHFNTGTYISPFSATGGFDSPRSFLGAGRPVPDNETAPTRLVGGTILAGEVRGSAALRAERLGIDAGPYTSVKYLAGEKGFGLALFGSHEHPASGSVIQDVSVLTTGIKNQHSVIVEGQHELRIAGLWVWTLGGTHGLVVKSDHSSVHDVHCRGASNDCLIVKSDYATDRAGYAAFDDISDVDIRYLARPGDTGGILVDSSWDQVHDVELRGIREEGLSYGVQIFSSWLHHPARLSIRDWHSTNTQGVCLSVFGVRDLTVNGFTCDWNSLAPAFHLEGDAIQMRNGHIHATANASARSDAILDLGTDTIFEHIQAANLRGYVLRSVHSRDKAALAAAGVASDGDILAPDPPEELSITLRLMIWKMQGKLALRILWTTAMTRFPHPYVVVAVLCLLVCALLLGTLAIRSRSGRSAKHGQAAV